MLDSPNIDDGNLDKVYNSRITENFINNEDVEYDAMISCQHAQRYKIWYKYRTLVKICMIDVHYTYKVKNSVHAFAYSKKTLRKMSTAVI